MLSGNIKIELIHHHHYRDGEVSLPIFQNKYDDEAFGYSISMSGDGKTIAVGAPHYK